MRPSDAIWWHRSGSPLAQVMAWCLTAPSHYLNQIDLSSVRSSGIHLSAILQGIPQPPVTKIRLNNTYVTFCSNLPGANELSSKSYIISMPHMIMVDQRKVNIGIIWFMLTATFHFIILSDIDAYLLIRNLLTKIFRKISHHVINPLILRRSFSPYSRGCLTPQICFPLSQTTSGGKSINHFTFTLVANNSFIMENIMLVEFYIHHCHFFSNVECFIFKHISVINIKNIFCESVLRWMSQGLWWLSVLTIFENIRFSQLYKFYAVYNGITYLVLVSESNDVFIC